MPLKKKYYNPKQAAHAAKYIKEKTDEIKLRVPKGRKDVYKAQAELHGKSLNQFIIDCIEKEV